MKCSEFIKRNRSGLEQDSNYMDHLEECNKCADFVMKKQLSEKKVELKKYPCVHLAYYSTHEDEYLAVNKHRQFGLRIPKELGGGMILIAYCPWCGKKALAKRKLTKS